MQYYDEDGEPVELPAADAASDPAARASRAGIAARDAVGYAELPDHQKATVDNGVHIARNLIRSGLSEDDVPTALKKAQLRHDAIVATLKAFRDNTEPSEAAKEATAWGRV